MRTTVRKLFWIWDFDKEEKWLNEMAAKGLCLVSVGFCRYEFEDCIPGEYNVRLELLKERPTHPESVKYLEFLEETGAEHIGTYLNWVYLRKKKDVGEFELFSDNESRIKHLTRIIQLAALLTVMNLFVSFYNLFLAVMWDSEVNYIGFLNLVLGAFVGYGWYRLWKKRKRLKDEQRLYE